MRGAIEGTFSTLLRFKKPSFSSSSYSSEEEEEEEEEEEKEEEGFENFTTLMSIKLVVTEAFKMG